MAIFNPTVAGGGGAWNVASYNGSSSGSNELTGFSFITLEGEPQKWCLVGITGTGSWYSNTSSGYITGAYRADRTTYINGYSLAGGDGARFYRAEPNRISTTYTESTRRFYISINNTGTVTHLAFPMKRSSYYFTWYLFYTV